MNAPAPLVSKSEQNRRAYLKRRGKRCPTCKKAWTQDQLARGMHGQCWDCHTRKCTGFDRARALHAKANAKWYAARRPPRPPAGGIHAPADGEPPLGMCKACRVMRAAVRGLCDPCRKRRRREYDRQRKASASIKNLNPGASACE